MLSNVLDLLQQANALINWDRIGGTELLGRGSVEEMKRERAKLPYTLFGGEAYGYRLTIYPRFPGRYKFVSRSGSVQVYTGFYGYIASEKLTVAVLAMLAATRRAR